MVPTEWNRRSEIDGSFISLCSSNSSGDNLSTGSNVWLRASESTLEVSKNAASAVAAGQKPRNLSLELDTRTKDPVPPTRRKANAMKPTLLAQAPAKIFLVWLESFEDHLNFPIGL